MVVGKTECRPGRHKLHAMITVIIPALNEEKTIEKVIQLAQNAKNVSEVIVVDDKSLDNTYTRAEKAGAKVITGTKLGKGASMKDGLLMAKNEIIVYIDADIDNYPSDLIEKMTNPLLSNEADFVKTFFSRQAGRVTELVAKPLLSILYPEFPVFQQPLSGMIAGKKALLSKITFEEGYGVDIGILIDMHKMGASIKEIDIGHIENKMQTLEQLGKMSKDVASVILDKCDKSKNRNLEMLEHIQIIREQMDFAISERSKQLKKIAIIDMDRTLLRGSFIQTCSEKFDFKTELIEIVTSQTSPFIRTKKIARLLKGRSVNELIDVADSIPISKNAEYLIYALRSNGYNIGIVSDSYDYITNYFMNKLKLDFTLANELEFSKSIVTGEVKIPSFFLPHEQSICTHELCKTHAIMHMCNHISIGIENTLCIGDGENDICMIKNAGIGIAFCPTHPNVHLVADIVISEPDMQLITETISL